MPDMNMRERVRQVKVKCFFGFLGIYKDILVFWGPRNNPLGVGGGVEKNNTCNYLAWALFTITKKHIFYVCLTNTVQKKTHTNKILRLYS